VQEMFVLNADKLIFGRISPALQKNYITAVPFIYVDIRTP